MQVDFHHFLKLLTCFLAEISLDECLKHQEIPYFVQLPSNVLNARGLSPFYQTFWLVFQPEILIHECLKEKELKKVTLFQFPFLPSFIFGPFQKASIFLHGLIWLFFRKFFTCSMCDKRFVNNWIKFPAKWLSIWWKLWETFLVVSAVNVVFNYNLLNIFRWLSVCIDTYQTYPKSKTVLLFGWLTAI